MGRPERTIDPEAGSLQRFAFDLRELRRHAGTPSYRRLATRACYSVTALSEAAGGDRLPTLEVTLAYVKACEGDAPEWEARWQALVAELATANGAGSQPATDAALEEAPYLGLDAFQPEDAERFFGRQDDIARVIDKLGTGRFLAVLGPSGCGKSSLVRAGVVPALAGGAVAGSDTWAVRIVTPTARPLSILAAQLGALLPGEPLPATLDRLRADECSLDLAVSLALAEHDPGERLLLVVDQFEETFTLCADEAERALFVANLCHAATVRGGRVVVLVAMRADFYHQCAAYPRLAALMADRQFLVSPLGPDGLREVIEQPARQAGLHLEPGLVETVLADVGDRPGTLPLLGYVLLEVWRRRRQQALTLEAYVASGGVEHALAQRADEIYQALNPARQAIARRVLLRLIQPGAGTEDTRRRAEMRELETRADEAADLEAVVHALADARLLTTSQDEITGSPTVDVSHEALIRGWPRLRAWLDEDRDLLRAQRRLAEAASEWAASESDGHGRQEGFLYQEARLAPWRERRVDDLNEQERAFLAASEERHARERAIARKRARLVLLSAATVLVLVAVLIMRMVEARGDTRAAFSRQLAANAATQATVDPQLSLLLAREAFETSPTAEAEAALRQATRDAGAFITLEGHNGSVHDAAFTPDGRRLVSAGLDGSIRLWELENAAGPKVFRGHEGAVQSIAIRPDGGQVASAGFDGTLRLWDPAGDGTPVLLGRHDGPVYGVVYSPDGRRAASAGEDGTVRVWDMAGGAHPIVLSGHEGPVYGVAFSPDGARLASGSEDGTVRVWDVAGGADPIVLGGHEGPVYGVAFSPDGRQVAGAGMDGTARVWDLDVDLGRGTERAAFRGGQGAVWDVAFSPDGRWLASANSDGTARIWDASAGLAGAANPLVLRGQEGPLFEVAYSPDGQRLASAANDGSIRVWDLGAVAGEVVLYGHENLVYRVAFSPDGQRVASASEDGTVRVWNTAGPGSVVLRGHEGPVYGIAFGPGGQQVASGGKDGTVRIWDLAGNAAPLVLRGHEGAVNAVAFGPDGRWVASAGEDGAVRIWTLGIEAGPLVLRGHAGPVESLAASHDGRVASAGEDGTVRVWVPGTGAQPLVLRAHHGPARAVAFSPDGRQVASAGDDGSVRMWASNTGGDPIELTGHEGAVYDVAFSPDGRHLVSAGQDATVRVWKTAGSATPVVLRGHGGWVYGVAFSPDGQRVASASYDQTVRLWSCEVCRPIEQVLALADARVTRELTPEERHTFLREPLGSNT